MNQIIKKRIEQINNGIVPEGYKRTKVGIVPNEWAETHLSTYLTVRTEKNKELRYGKSDVFSISGEQGIVNQIELLGRSYAGVSVAPYSIVYPNDVVYTKSPLKASPYGIIKTNKTGKAGIVSTLYAVFQCKENVYPVFVQYYFELDQKLNNYLYPIVNIGAKHDMKISDENSLKGVVVFPPYHDQVKIAEILSTQDKVIELKEKLIEQKRLEKGIIVEQVLFLDDSTISECKIGEICDAFSGGTPSRKIPEYYNGDIPWIKSGELNCRIITSADESISLSGLNNSSAKMVKPGTLLIAMYGATAGAIAFSGIEAAINQAILAVIPIIDINSNYLYYALESKIEKLVIKFTQGGQPNLNAQIIKSFRIKLPGIDAQNRICDILQTKDKEIELLEQELEQEKQKKKALMQLLLTGIVRVK